MLSAGGHNEAPIETDIHVGDLNNSPQTLGVFSAIIAQEVGNHETFTDLFQYVWHRYEVHFPSLKVKPHLSRNGDSVEMKLYGLGTRR